MKTDLDTLLYTWPQSVITDNDLAVLLSGTRDRRYALIKRAIRDEKLIHLKKGLYFIGKPFKTALPNLFEIAQRIYGPSYISLESALSYHNWIPEAVYTVTSVCPKRNNHFMTSLGVFNYSHVPNKNFYMSVERVESEAGTFLMATPIKALADYVYVYRKLWHNFEDVSLDLRVEMENIRSIDKQEIELLVKNYPSRRVGTFLKKLLKERANGH